MGIQQLSHTVKCMQLFVKRSLAAVEPRNITVCGDSVREKTVYSSTGNSIEVTVMQMEGNSQKKSIGKIGGVDEALAGGGKTYFMLKYEGKGYMFAFDVR